MIDDWDAVIEGSQKLDVDLRHLREAAINCTPPARRKRERRKDEFVLVPMVWVQQLQKASHTSTYRLALHLLFHRWKGGGTAITVSNVALAGAGISRREKWRALVELENLGLIRVERRSKQSPLVTVLA